MKKAKAVVAVPSFRDFYATPHRLSALGALIVENILADRGWETHFFQFPLAAGQVQDLPASFSHLRPNLLSGEFGPTAFFSRYHRFGPAPDRCADVILAQNPDAVFISCFAFAYADDTLALAGHIKNKRPATAVHVGGAGVSVLPEYFQRHACIDTVIGGEAESSLTHFLSTGSQPPFTARGGATASARPHVAIAARHTPRKVLWLTTSLSRGCPRQCTFCANHLTQGRQFRKIGVAEFLNALASFSPDGPVHINFEDDNILMDREYLYEILAAAGRMFPRVSFSAENGLDYRRLDRPTLERLIGYGFTQFNLSLAACSPAILKASRRHGNLQRLQHLLDALQRHNLPAIVYFICGLKADTADTVMANLLFLNGQPARAGISLFYPVPGLPGFEDPRAFLAGDSHLCTGSAAFPWTGALTTSQMVTAFRLARYLNLAQKGQPSSRDRELLTHIQREKKLYTLQRTDQQPRMVRPPGLDREMEAAFFRHI